MLQFRETHFLPTRNNILLGYAYTLMLFAVLLFGKNITGNTGSSPSTLSFIFYSFLLISGISLQIFVQYKLVRAQFITVCVLILGFYLQSFLTVEESLVGVTRYYFFLSLLLLIPLFTRPIKTAVIYVVFLTFQIGRSIAIEQEWIQIHISEWTSIDYINTYTLLSVFCLFIFSVMQREFKRLLNELKANKEEQEIHIKELKKLEGGLNEAYNKEKDIFQLHYKHIENAIQRAESALKSEMGGGKPDFKQWVLLCNEMDEEIRSVDKLTEVKR